MAKTETIDYPRGLTFEKVWAMFQETDRKFQENAQQLKETREQMKETDRKIGDLGNRFGEVIEYMVMPNLVKKFQELGFVFTKAYPHATIEDEKNNIITEIDITLENGDKVMIVEVKSKPSTEHIIEHIERMQKVKAHANLHGDRRVFLGAVGGMIFNRNERNFALKHGFYVIEPSGNTFTITAPEGTNKPREW